MKFGKEFWDKKLFVLSLILALIVVCYQACHFFDVSLALKVFLFNASVGQRASTVAFVLGRPDRILRDKGNAEKVWLYQKYGHYTGHSSCSPDEFIYLWLSKGKIEQVGRVRCYPSDAVFGPIDLNSDHPPAATSAILR